MFNCIYDCDYCYLQGMYPSANIVVFVNHEDFFDAVDMSQGIETILDGSIKNQLGLLLRGGVELRNTRISLEYNLIPTADIQIDNGEVVGTVKNTYLGLSFGFTIIGRKSSI